MTPGRTAIVALAFVYVATTLFWWCDMQPWRWLDSGTNSNLFKALIWVVPSILVVRALRESSLPGTLSAFGLRTHPLKGLAFGIAATLPMGIAALANGLTRSTPDFLVGAVVLGPFAEEVLFRGFLFQELLRRSRWSIGWAVGVSAVVFGAAHVTALPQPALWGWLVIFGPNTPGADPQLVALAHAVPMTVTYLIEPVVQLTMPAVAGAVFAWVLFRTNTLWTAIGLHGALNFWSVVSHGQGMRIPRDADATSIAQGFSLVFAVVLAEWQWRRQQRSSPTSVPHP